MNLLVDAMSVSNLSGRHVLFGHLRQIARARSARWRIGLLLNQDNASLSADAPPGIETYIAPTGGRWWQRAVWMHIHGDSWCEKNRFDMVFSPSGMLSIGRVPQLVLAQNPWPMMSPAMLGKQRLRAWVQRRAYARAQKRAACMAFNSAYMLELYRARFGARQGREVVAHQGIADDLFNAYGPEKSAEPSGVSQSLIVSLSVMARHKAVETLINAFAKVREKMPAARLELAGPWPDRTYRSEIEAQIVSLQLSQAVRIHGFMPDLEIKFLLGRARVFALMSRCESFGIPAVEAQAFGVPAVVADGTAAPEIIGKGGIVVAPGDVEATASALLKLLRDDEVWHKTSQLALANAQRFRWQVCSAPLVAALDQIAEDLTVQKRP